MKVSSESRNFSSSEQHNMSVVNVGGGGGHKGRGEMRMCVDAGSCLKVYAGVEV